LPLKKRLKSLGATLVRERDLEKAQVFICEHNRK
jgi:hypothetical protein